MLCSMLFVNGGGWGLGGGLFAPKAAGEEALMARSGNFRQGNAAGDPSQVF